ncbi:MAG: SBBP repeat-containing protein [Silvibacterium sp.]
MSGRVQVYRKLAGATACGAILLAGLAAGSRWHRAAKSAGTMLPTSALAAGAQAANRSKPPAPRTVAIPHRATLSPSIHPPSSELHAATAPLTAPTAAIPPASRARVVKMYAALPMTFEANNGQTDSQVKFLARAPGYTLFLTDKEAVLSLPESTPAQTGRSTSIFPVPHPISSHTSKRARIVRLKFVGGNTPTTIAGRGQLPGTSNYFIGNDPKQWHTNVPDYSAVEYRGLYSGVDAVFHGNQQRLEYDFMVAPGADLHAIGLDVEGAERLRIDSRGNLALHVGQSELKFKKPVVYQEVAGRRREIAGSFVLRGPHRIGFSLGSYDRSLPLVIDPTLVYSTYLGGSYQDVGKAIAVDSYGDTYVTGSAASTDFPVTSGAFETAYNYTITGFVSELNPSGSALIYSSYFGTPYNPEVSEGQTVVTGIAVDAQGDAYMTGYVSPASGEPISFPTTPGAFETSSSTGSAFVAELNPTGTALVYSTLLSGTETKGSDATTGFGIALDVDGNAYVTGTTSSPTYPTTTGAFQTQGCTTPCGGNGFITKVSAGGSSLSYSTYLGTGSNKPQAIAVDSSGNAYVVGETEATTFPVTSGAFQTTSGDALALFVTKLNSTGTALSYSTFLNGSNGTSSGEALAVAVDASGYAYVTGHVSDSNFPTTPGAYQTRLLDEADAFVTKVNLTGSALEYSTYLPGGTTGYGIQVNSSGEAYVAGNQDGADLPTTPDAFQTTAPTTTTNGFLTVFNADGSGLVYSTYLGVATSNDYGDQSDVFGIALDSDGNAYLTGSAPEGFPTTSGALKTTLTPGVGSAAYPTNAIVMKITFAGSTTLSISPATLDAGTAGVSYGPVTFTATGATGTVAFAVTTGSLPSGLTLSSDGELSGTPTQTGTSSFTVTATDSNNDTGSQAFSLQIGCPTITVGPSTLATGTSGTAYPAATFTETGGVGTTTFAESGALPTGMTFVTPVLSGTPTQTGSFPIQVTATDSNSCSGSISDTLMINAATGQPAVVMDNETITVTDTETFADVADSEPITVTDIDTVRAYSPIAITPSPASFNASSGTGFATYAYGPVQFTATGGTGTLTLSESGTLPAGVTFTNGALSGTPAASATGTYTFSITASDTFGDQATLQGYTLTIQAASAYPAFVTDNETITVTDTETFADVADSEPITVTDTDTVRAYTPILITPSAASFNASSGTGYVGQSYGPVQFTATGGTGTLTLSETGALPSGLTFNNGALSGTLSPSSTGAYTFSITATDADGDQTTQQGYTLTIAAVSPSFKIGANPDALTIIQGQTGETTITATPTGGYIGSLALSCSNLPANTKCVFTQNGVTNNTLTLNGSNLPVAAELTLETSVGSLQARINAAPASSSPMLPAVVLWWPGGLVGLAAFRRKRKTHANRQRWFGLCLLLALLAGVVTAGLAGCGMSGGFGTYVTPVGTSTVTVTATPASGTAQALSIDVTITR